VGEGDVPMTAAGVHAVGRCVILVAL
jgi:hypothetical protein